MVSDILRVKRVSDGGVEGLEGFARFGGDLFHVLYPGRPWQYCC